MPKGEKIKKRKEYTKTYSSLKVKCSCGLELFKQNLPRHIKSKQHIEAPEKVKQIPEDKTNSDITISFLTCKAGSSSATTFFLPIFGK